MELFKITESFLVKVELIWVAIQPNAEQRETIPYHSKDAKHDVSTINYHPHAEQRETFN